MSYLTASKSSSQYAVERAERECIECRPEWDECDEDFDEKLEDSDLDPGFSSWDDYNNYKY